MKFHTTILQGDKTATGIRIPDEVVEALGSGKRPLVKVTINGFTYRSSIATVSGASMVGVSAENRAGAGVAGGDEVDVEIELDTEPREMIGTGRAGRRARRRAEGTRDVRQAVEQQQGVARDPGHRCEDRRDAAATDREVGRDPPRGPPALSAPRPRTSGGETRQPLVTTLDLNPYGAEKAPECSGLAVSLLRRAPHMRAEIALSATETRELARLAVALAVVSLIFALLGVGIVLQTGDPASAAGALIMAALAGALIHARRELMRGRSRRAVTLLLVVSVLAGALVSAPIPPPVPALAALPIMAVAFALSFLDGRPLKVALIAAWLVAVATAIIVEFTPASPDLPPVVAAALRVGAFAAIIWLVALVLYRHRRRLQQAVTDAQASSDALRDSEARYRTVVESVREVIFRVDRDGRWALLNHAWEELTGHRVVNSVGRPIMRFIHPDDRELNADLIVPAASGQVQEFRHELRLVGRDGSDIWVEVRARPINDDAAGFGGMSGTLTDITRRHELEERLLEQAFHDDLTGLANRALFKDRVEHALTRRSPDRATRGTVVPRPRPVQHGQRQSRAHGW